MKSTTLASALVLLYVLLSLPDADGTRRGPLVHPGSTIRPQQTVGVHPGPIRPQRAVPQGHFKQPGRPEQAGMMAAGRPRYARHDLPTGSTVTLAASTLNNGMVAARPFVVRELASLNNGAGSLTVLVAGATAEQTTAANRLDLALTNTGKAFTSGAVTVIGGAMGQDGSRRRRKAVKT